MPSKIRFAPTAAPEGSLAGPLLRPYEERCDGRELRLAARRRSEPSPCARLPNQGREPPSELVPGPSRTGRRVDRRKGLVAPCRRGLGRRLFSEPGV